jgi:hypothetical protein
MSQRYSDPYFEGDEDVLKSYNLNHEQYTSFYQSLNAWVACTVGWCYCGPCCIPIVNANIKDLSRARHIALTRDGIRYVVEKHPSFLRCSCCDVGKTSKTLPYDKITDCDVEEPAGTAFCCCVKNVLMRVNVDTASSGGSVEGLPKHDLTIEGLAEAHAFKKDVWAMKRGDGLIGVPDSVVATSMTRVEQPGKGVGSGWFGGGAGGGKDLSELGPLLREQTSLLQQAVGYLKIIADK